MRLAFDATPLLDVVTGVGRFVGEVLRRLGRTPDVDVIAYGLTRRYRAELARALPPHVRGTHWPVPARSARRLWRRFDGPVIERWTGPVDIVHGPNFVVPPAKRAVELVTVHDLSPVHFPELCDEVTSEYPALVRRAIARGAHVHTPSEFVAREVIEMLGAHPDRVHPVANGVTVAPSGDPSAGAAMAGGSRFVLTVGRADARKDFPALIRAFDAVAADDPDLRLVMAGPDGSGTPAVTATLESAHHRDRVVRLGWVDEAQRLDLLAGATVFAYPSRYEGFGLPPLEAMAAATPVVAVDIGATREVLDDAALFVPGGDHGALASALASLLGDPDLRAELVGRGRARVAGYTWDRCSDGLLQLYERLCAVGRTG